MALGLLLAGLAPALAQEQPESGRSFLPDDPIAVDPDRLDVPPPTAVEASDVADFVANTFFLPADYEGPARNANTMEEVPNSSWYTWRHYHERMGLEALKRGPNPSDSAGPAPGTWTVVSTKEEGKSVGMQIEDRRGDRYLLKFDPPGYAELSTGAEVVATKFFYALGYHVPENYVTAFAFDRLELGDDVDLSRSELRRLLAKAARYSDGRYRALASKFLEGKKPLGPFKYYGTRSDDANDVFPHESRRELRGLRVFAAWLNHVDARGVNSLDMLVEVEGDQYVRHHLIDFGTTLGGGPLGPKDRWQSYEYSIQPGRIALRIFSLGFAGEPWLSVEYPEYPSVGHFEAEHFDPEAWKPLHPNPAFQRMDAADAFWAARQVMHFTDEEIRAIVETGAFSDPEAEAYLAETLMERRDKIGRAYLGFGGGMDRFRVRDGASGEQQLVFEDLLAMYGWAPDARVRRITWRTFDNQSGRPGRTLGEQTTAAEAIPLPEDPQASFLQADIETREDRTATTQAYLRRQGDGYEMVGLRRDGQTLIEAQPRSPAAASAAK